MFEEIPQDLLYEWMAFDQLEPFGPLTSWWQNARVMAQQANLWRGKHQKAFEMRDFMPTFEPPKKKSPDEIYAMFRTFAVLNGATPNVERST